MKIIKRIYLDNLDDKVDVRKRGNFIVSGVREDGHFSYSRLDDNNNIIPEDEGMYYQIKSMKYHLLIMIRA